MLAYLPLAHILEMALENLVLFIGGTLGYGSPRTLADASVKNCAGDMRELKPTVMAGVPQIWETIRKGVMSRLDTSNPILRALFWGALSFKSFMVQHKLPGATLFDGVVFGKVRELTGGQLRFTFNGGSGISDSTKQFVSLVLAPMMAGYGLTETCAAGALGCPLEYTSSAIGPIPGSCEAKLMSIPDLGYLTDVDHNEVPQGEIWLRGMPIMTEYIRNPEETANALTPDGWFKTGDIGEFDADGHLRIIDRVKNLVKMQGGEYIALEKVEAVYRGSQVVTNVMVQADAGYPRPIAVVVINEKVLAAKAQEQRLGVDEHSMYRDPKARNLVLRDLQATGRRAGLSEMEIVSGVVVTDEEWTPASVSEDLLCRCLTEMWYCRLLTRIILSRDWSPLRKSSIAGQSATGSKGILTSVSKAKLELSRGRENTDLIYIIKYFRRIAKHKKTKSSKTQAKHTTPRIPRSSPTLVLIRLSAAYIWESGRDP